MLVIADQAGEVHIVVSLVAGVEVLGNEASVILASIISGIGILVISVSCMISRLISAISVSIATFSVRKVSGDISSGV
jgi:hypothetical protein